MINDIVMEAVASYTDRVHIQGLKKFNIFYGLNGAGKTILSQCLANHFSNREKRNDFSKCKLTFKDPNNLPKIFVYNEDFIQENFWVSDPLKGIFTIGKENTEAEQAIATARTKITELNEKKKPYEGIIQNLKNQQIENRNIFKDKVWQDKILYERTSLKKCLGGTRGDKERFLERLINVKKPEQLEAHDIIKDKLNNLSIELEQLSATDIQPILEHDLLNFKLESCEDDPIFNEKIVGSQDSYLSNLIDKLNHSDWVNQGIINYLDKTEDCPFCNRKMQADLKEKIKTHIDNTYQVKLSELTTIQKAYQENKSDIEEKLKIYKKNPRLINNSALKDLITQLELTLKNNLILIDKKSKEPSQMLELNSTSDLITNINQIIIADNNNILEFNTKINNTKEAIEDITTKFWALLRNKYDQEITEFEQKATEAEVNVQTNQVQITEISNMIDANNVIIKENISKSKTKNINTAIENINIRLKNMGCDGFKIKEISTREKDEYFYKLDRSQSTENVSVFKTLSEGEKTLITFLYFVEQCCGIDKEEDKADLNNRIIVIDDPISSLSFNLIFDIAILITDIFLSKKTEYLQIFILTHHLYFFHELHNLINSQGDKAQKFWENNLTRYRITKFKNTKISTLNKNTIQNNYECFWQIIKDVQAKKANSILLANAMRNILEHYFAFISHKDTLSAKLKELSTRTNDNSIKAFNRYIQRGSHSDAINLTDMNDIESSKFINHFKTIFQETGHIEHYNLMMEEH